MSGGFFRGTSTDQDSRFSNKQAKLLKSHKFPPELDHLVDITKVKMDVIRPWIATRATELLGFEDEVLINYIYGLLEGKAVDGKQIQIQLTGFMEKNTRKFMKELWGLLLSAQRNASGIPQQFLDAKEVEMKKKKVESDRITQEIQRRKERGGWESEQDRQNRLDGKADVPGPTHSARNDNLTTEVASKEVLTKISSSNLEDEVDADGKLSSRRKSRSIPSPRHNDDSPRLSGRTPSACRSRSKSYSNSRSRSRERNRSRSISGSPHRMRWSTSPGRHYRSPSGDSVSPRRMSRSPSLRRPSRSRKRSVSRSRNFLPSPIRHRSPQRSRSPSPLQWSSLSRRRRTPLRHRSPTPQRHRSPRHRSPVNFRRVSPSQHRFPYRRRTPQRHASRSPLRKSPPRSPRYLTVHSPRRSQNSPPHGDRSHSLSRSRSPRNRYRRRLSKDRDGHSNGVTLRKQRVDFGSQRSPVRTFCESGESRKAASGYTESNPAPHQSISLRSPQRDKHVDKEKRHASPSFIEGELADDVEMKAKEKSTKSHAKQYGDKMSVPTSSEKSNREVDDTAHVRKRKYSPEVARSKEVLGKFSDFEETPRERPAVERSADTHSARGHTHDHDTSHIGLPKKLSESSSHLTEEIEYGPGRLAQHSTGFFEEDRPSGKSNVISKESYQFSDKKRRHYKDSESGSPLHQSHTKIKRKAERGNIESPMGSDSEDDTHHKHHNTYKNSGRPDNKDALSDEDGLSPKDDLKEAKRRRKEDKRLRKEEKRRKREERHRRREERRAEKLKAKCVDRASPSDDGRALSADYSDGHAVIKDTSPSNREDTESEQRKLEIQLREKALESLRAKKAATK